MTPEQLELLNEALDHEYAYWRDMATDPKPERHAKMAKVMETQAKLNNLVRSRPSTGNPALVGRARMPDEKHEVMCRILKAWCKSPEQRLGQFLINAAGTANKLYYLEDYALVKTVEGRAPTWWEGKPLE